MSATTVLICDRCGVLLIPPRPMNPREIRLWARKSADRTDNWMTSMPIGGLDICVACKLLTGA